MRQVAGRYTQVIICTKTTSVDPDPCVRWKYPEWLSVQTQHLLILTHVSGSRRIYPAVIRTHTVLLPQPVRSQVACGDTQGLFTHTHTHKFVTPTCENRVTSRDTQGLSVHTFMLPRPLRSQVACGDALYSNPHIFQRQKCLQSLHAFKGDNVLTHFEGKNVFSHCMPSKSDNDPHLHFEDDNVFSHCMSSKATMSSFTFQRRQYLLSLHAFKR